MHFAVTKVKCLINISPQLNCNIYNQRYKKQTRIVFEKSKILRIVKSTAYAQKQYKKQKNAPKKAY